MTQPRVIILAGGKGRRLRPYTMTLPKPLLPLGEMPVLEILLRRLRRSGFRDVTLAVSHLPELIENVCGDGARFGLKIRYSREHRPLSTAGPLALVRGLRRAFLVINGDILTNLDYRALLRFHGERRAAATVAVHRRRLQDDFGIIEVGAGGILAGWTEKPQHEHVVSMGVYALQPRVLRYIRPGKALDMPALILRLRDAGEKVLVYESSCLWLDIGRPEDYEAATEMFARHRAELLGERVRR